VPPNDARGGPLVRRIGDPAACDVATAGAKGAGLAQAKAAGLPVPDGFVVSPAASAPALELAEAQMEGRGSGGARMAIIGCDLGRELLDALAEAARALPEPLIVRSSSVLEGSGEWSGAFTSVPEVRRGVKRLDSYGRRVVLGGGGSVSQRQVNVGTRDERG